MEVGDEMSIDGEWEMESTDILFRLRDDGYWEAKIAATKELESRVFTSRSETMAIGFALRDHAEMLIREAPPTAEDYERTGK